MNSNDLKLRHLKYLCIRNVTISQVQSPNQTKTEPTSIKLPKKNPSKTSNYNFDGVDIFFSLYYFHKKKYHLVYISEIVNDFNINFSTIQLPSLPLKIENSCKIKLKIWYKPGALEVNWRLLSTNIINFKKLSYISDSVHILDDSLFKANALILNLNGRFYGYSKDVLTDISGLSPAKQSKALLTSYSFDSIRQLNNLANSLYELVITKHKIDRQIKRSLSNLPATNKSDILKPLILNEQAVVDDLNSKILLYKSKINQIHHFTKYKTDTTNEKNHLELVVNQIDPILDSIHQYIYPLILQELHQIGQIISEVLVIENIDNSIKFLIMGISFPPSIKEILQTCYHSDDEMSITRINAGLVYIIQLINCLADVTNSYLQYSIELINHQWVITDSLSACSPATFPLYYDESTTEKIDTNPIKYLNQPFEMGLTLLTKNLTRLSSNTMELFQLFNRNQVHLSHFPNDCPDNFLWNLHYILLCVTAPQE